MVVLIPIVPRADAGWYLAVPLVIAGIGLGLLVSQLNNYTLAPIDEERVSEAAGVNSAAGSFGLSFGLAFAGAIMLATLAVQLHGPGGRRAPCSPRPSNSRSPQALEHDAEVMTNTDLEAAARRPAAGDPGRDHPHQHRGAAAGASGGAAHPDPGQPARPVRVVPDDAPTGSRLIGRRRRAGPGVTSSILRSPSSTRGTRRPSRRHRSSPTPGCAARAAPGTSARARR